MRTVNLLLRHVAVWTLVLQLSGLALFAQPILIQPNDPFGQRPVIGMGVENLRVVEQSADGTEALLTMDYSYDGFAGTTAKIVPMIGKKGQRGVSGWFGSDPVTIGRGSGTISIKVKYFNDEPGVPPMFTSDQVQVFILNQTGTARLFAVPFLKTIKWGHPSTKPAATSATAPALSRMSADEARKLAEEKRVAEERARGEAELREKARLQAEAEAKARQEAEKRALAEAIDREEAQRKAEEEAKRIAAELKRAEEKRLAEAREREDARKAAEALEKQLAEEKRLAEERVRKEAEAKERVRLAAEAKTREEARLKAEIEAKRLTEERRIAEERARAEALAQEEARRKAEAEAKRLAEEQRIAELKALAETKARKEAEEKAWREALAQAKAELEAKQLAAEKREAEVIVQSAASNGTSMEMATGIKTRVTNVDVVNRSIDRTQMTFGVEFEYRDKLPDPLLGVDVVRQAEPDVSRFFASRPAEIGRSRRNFVLLPVKFQPPAGMVDSSGFSTDKVMVYLQEKKSARRYNIFPATMLLLWSAGGRIVSAESSGNTVEIDDFKQNDASNGYISIKYNLIDGRGRLRAKVYEAEKPGSAVYFETQVREVQAGRGLQLIDVRLLADSRSPTDVVPADTIDVELLDANGTVLAKVSKQAAMVWARPK